MEAELERTLDGISILSQSFDSAKNTLNTAIKEIDDVAKANHDAVEESFNKILKEIEEKKSFILSSIEKEQKSSLQYFFFHFFIFSFFHFNISFSELSL